MAIDTPARHIYTGNGNQRVFPIPTKIIGDDYIRIEIDSIYQSDRTKWDIVNNSVIFITAPLNGTTIDIQVATSEEALSVLGSSTSMDIVAESITNVNTVATNIVDINQIVDNLPKILLADDNATTATQQATIATTKASEASASANQALTSRNQAETFKNSASTSATTATTKASEASVSATSASTSANQALTSRNQAETFAQQAKASAKLVNSIAELKLINGSNDDKLEVFGYYEKGDGGGGLFYWDGTSTEADNGGTIIQATGVTTGRWKRVFSGAVNVKWFGLNESNTAAQNNTAIISAHNSLSEGVLYFPKGKYKYDNLNSINLGSSNFTYKGDGSNSTTLEYLGTGTAFNLDGFYEASGSQTFKQGCNVEGIQFLGSSMTIGLRVRGIAKSYFRDIKVNGFEATVGAVNTGRWFYGGTNTRGFSIEGAQLNNYTDCYCSYADGNVANNGFWLANTTQNAVTTGGPSNNVFTHCYAEGNYVGVFIASGDNNVWSGGSSEACFNYGLINIGRYNTFIGVGLENKFASSGYDVSNSGKFAKFINCYCSLGFREQGTSTTIYGGYYQYIKIEAIVKTLTLENIILSHWGAGTANGINNLATSEVRFFNLYDEILSSYIYNISLGSTQVPITASPVEYTNTTSVTQKVKITNGTVTRVIVKTRGGNDLQEHPKPTASNLGTVGIYDVAPGDVILISYSTAPDSIVKYGLQR